MANSLSRHYFGDTRGVERDPEPDLIPLRKIPQLRKAKQNLPMSRAVNEDNWLDFRTEDCRVVFTPYGKGTVTGENDAGTHYRVRYACGNVRRVIKKNCTDKMKLADYGRQKKYAIDKDTPSTTGRPYRGVLDALKSLGSDPAVLESVCQLNGLDYGKYKHLNPGHQRMCIGNVLRGRLKNGNRIWLGVDWELESPVVEQRSPA